MSTIRIKRRSSGAAGAPASLQNAELAYNEVDDTLYYGKGTGGAGGSATSIEAVAGAGAMVTKTSAQTISGDKTFTGQVIVPTATQANHAVTKAQLDAASAAAGQVSSVNGYAGAVVLAAADVGAATPAYVDGKVAALVASAPAALDTLNELATALGNDANFSTTITNQLASKANTSSLATVATSGSYTDLANKPAIPSQYTDAQARAAISATGSLSYNSTTGVISYTAPALATVATSGAYADLSGKPTIPSDNSQLANGAGYITSAALADLDGGTF